MIPSSEVIHYSEVIHGYGQLASTVSRMAALARASQWEQLPDLEDQCASVADQLKRTEPLVPLDSLQREEVQHLVNSIREDQEEVYRLVKPQLDRLMARMADLQMQNNIGPAYSGLLH